MIGFAALVALMCLIGLVQCLAGAVLVSRFRAKPAEIPADLPPITVLKPLHGDEPLLEDALDSFCAQSYPRMQIVFGMQRHDDPALSIVRRLQARHPGRDLAMVVDPRRHGPNGKVSNLINMLPAARHDVLVISDSDVHADRDYLLRVAATLQRPMTGLATTLYSGMPAGGSLAAKLGATQITHLFLPGALLSRALGRRDCLGATMALHRETLEQIGGLGPLADHLADDNELGRRVRLIGLEIGLAPTIPQTTVAETSLRALFEHELRWARTIRALVPGQFAASVLQYPLFWGMLAILLSGFAAWALLLGALAWTVRAVAALLIDRRLGLANRAPVWLLPLRDIMSVVVLAASYAGHAVRWRGERMSARPPRPASEPAQTVRKEATG